MLLPLSLHPNLLLLLHTATQNGKRIAFAMLEDCQQLASAASAALGSASQPSRLLLGLQEPVLGLQPLGAGAGVEVTTQKRRYNGDSGGCSVGSASIVKLQLSRQEQASVAGCPYYMAH
jgi:hypothetical protein